MTASDLPTGMVYIVDRLLACLSGNINKNIWEYKQKYLGIYYVHSETTRSSSPMVLLFLFEAQ